MHDGSTTQVFECEDGTLPPITDNAISVDKTIHRAMVMGNDLFRNSRQPQRYRFEVIGDVIRRYLNDPCEPITCDCRITGNTDRTASGA